MFRNYLLIGFRNLRKHFSYSVINIVGLGLGLATCLLLVTWIRHELSYDRFHADSDKLYRATLEMSFGGQVNVIEQTPNKLLPELIQNSPEIESGTRFYDLSSYSPFIVQYKDALFQEGHFSFADSTFFNVFSFEFIHGNPQKALDEPYTVVLTESTARKYFGNENPLGKVLKINSTSDYTVTGVMRDVPTNSSIQFDFLGSFQSIRYGRDEPGWYPANFLTFIRISEKTDLTSISGKVNEKVKVDLASELTGENDYVRYSFIPLGDIHLKEQGKMVYVYVFSAIAVLILLIACINYINLSTARAADRAKEVGIRKVVGAMRKQLFGQFIGESVLITFLAFITSLLIVQTMLPVFNAITGKNFPGHIFFDPLFLTYAVIILTAIALLSGAYPAIAISGFKPVSILKGNFRFSGKGIMLRKILVVTQFTISVTLIVSTLVIYKQLNYIRDKKLGYDKENTIILPMDSKTGLVYEQLKTELIKSGRASYVARASESPTEISAGYGLSTEGSASARDFMATAITVDTEFIPAFGMELIEGRNFTEADFAKVKADTTRRSSSFIVNEQTLKELYITPEKAVGTKLTLSGRGGEIVGVVKDFHFASMRQEIKPLVLFNEVEQFDHIFIRLNPDNITNTLEQVKKIYQSLLPHRPFEYQFVDQQYATLYDAEERISTIFIGFASLAIIIACLGLLGLVSFSASQKTKEIGIRKVLGANTPSIVVLIIKDFTLLIFLAILIGGPLSYYIMTQWLKDFAYKTDIGVGPVLISSLLCVIIAFGTAGFQAIKAALLDPAETLRNE
jgi:putative ABC transport system permease protein